jgi:uncharacterized DUF497 family protein
MRYEWDEAKRQSNIQKHGYEEAAYFKEIAD